MNPSFPPCLRGEHQKMSPKKTGEKKIRNHPWVIFQQKKTLQEIHQALWMFQPPQTSLLSNKNLKQSNKNLSERFHEILADLSLASFQWLTKLPPYRLYHSLDNPNNQVFSPSFTACSGCDSHCNSKHSWQIKRTLPRQAQQSRSSRCSPATPKSNSQQLYPKDHLTFRWKGEWTCIAGVGSSK